MWLQQSLFWSKRYLNTFLRGKTTWFMGFQTFIRQFAYLFSGIWLLNFFLAESLKFFQLTGRCKTFSPKHLLEYKKNHLSMKRQVKTRNLLKLLNMHWVLNTMHPKLGTSSSLTFYFDTYSKHFFSKSYCNLTVHSNLTKLIESGHKIPFLIFVQPNNFYSIIVDGGN